MWIQYIFKTVINLTKIILNFFLVIFNTSKYLLSPAADHILNFQCLFIYFFFWILLL